MRTRHFLGLLIVAALLACGRGGSATGDVDTALLHRAGGDVMLADGGRLAYEITSDRYRQWETARRALRAARIGLTMRLDPLRVTEAEIQKAVDFFERNGRARRLIEESGLSVRDYVLTTIALEQQMAVASGRWGAGQQPRMPSTPVVPSESIAAELARDTSRRVFGRDTARPRVDTIPIVDTVVVPVDTLPPPDPDPVPPDPAPPPPSDTSASPTASPTP